MTNEELIAALEAADGPSRELDLDIAINLGLITKPVERGCWIDPGECIDGGKEEVGETFVAPKYTSSIDAALMLVPEGMTIGLMSVGDVYHFGIGENDRQAQFYAVASHPALAICIAALKANGFTVVPVEPTNGMLGDGWGKHLSTGEATGTTFARSTAQ